MKGKGQFFVYPLITFCIRTHIKLYEYILTDTICCGTIKNEICVCIHQKMDSVFWFRKGPEVNYEESKIPVHHKKYK